MDGFQQSSVVRRIAVSLIAIYALLLQGFLTSTLTLPSTNSPAGINCALNDLNGDVPDGIEHGHRGLCCILTCVAGCCAFVSALVTFAFVPVRVAQRFVFAEDFTIEGRRPLRFYFAARAPPRMI